MVNNLQTFNPKLFDLLSALDKKKLRKLEQWLASPAHNTSEEVLQLYQGLKHHHGKFCEPISKSMLLKYLGLPAKPEESVHQKHEGMLSITMFKLTEQVRKFLIWQHINENKPLEKQLLMKVLAKEKIYEHLPRIIRKSKKELNDAPYRTLDYYEYMLYINELEFGLEIALNNRKAYEKMQGLLDVLHQSSLSKILKYYCAAKNIERIQKAAYQYPLMECIEAYIHNNADKDVPIIKTYFILLKLQDEEKPAYYYQLKNYLFEKIHLFDEHEIRQFFNHMTNYCKSRIKEGDSQFYKENHDIHQKGLELKCWTTGIYFSAQQFIRFIANALASGKRGWVDDFMNAYVEQLHPELKDNTLHYSNALISFHKKQYDIAHDFLNKINKPEDFIEHLKLKVLLIKIYYELKLNSLYNADGMLIDYELDAVKKFVGSTRNKKMSESMRLAYNNFVIVLSNILARKKKRLKGCTVTQKNLEALQAKIADTRPLVERDWLEEKVGELAGKARQ